MVDCIDTNECGKELKISPQVVLSRLKRLKAGVFIGGKWWINPEEVRAIGDFRRAYNNQSSKYNKKKIHIVDFFLTHSTNSSVDIAQCLDLNVSRVNATLDEYFENENHIIVESKLNKEI